MGKAKKIKVSKGETKASKISLVEQIESEKITKPKNRQKIRQRIDEEEEVSLLHIYFLSKLKIIKFFENIFALNICSDLYFI